MKLKNIQNTHEVHHIRRTCRNSNGPSKYQINYHICIFYYDFPDNDIYAVKNSCRNPNNIIHPWCYTMNQEHSYGYCMIPMCSEPAAGTHPECKHDRLGMEYQGKMNKTISGHACVPWTMTNYLNSDNFPDNNIDVTCVHQHT